MQPAIFHLKVYILPNENEPVYGRYISRFLIGKHKINDPIKFIEENYFSYGILERIDLFIMTFPKSSIN